MRPNQQTPYQLDILYDYGSEVPGAKVLDLGCGSGKFLKSLSDAGCDAYGVDVAIKHEPSQLLIKEGRIRLVDPTNYRLPFEDGFFDFVVSNQVLEHVADLETTFAEVSRVLRKDGIGLHIFPSRYRPVEPHVGIPLATVVRAKWWLYLWRGIGLKPRSIKKDSIRSTVNAEAHYLKSSTFYRTQKQLKQSASRYFNEVGFREDLFLKNSPNEKGRRLYRLSKSVPYLTGFYRTFRSHVLIVRK